MNVTNANVERLVAEAKRLCAAIDEAATGGYLTDHGTLQALASQVRNTAGHVEYDLGMQDDQVSGADDHLEAQYENDQGDVDL
jgi:hypothetical protein